MDTEVDMFSLVYINEIVNAYNSKVIIYDMFLFGRDFWFVLKTTFHLCF